MPFKFEGVNREILNAKTIKERDAILKRSYVDNICGKVGDELLEHHLEKLETIVSHLAAAIFGVPRMMTVKNSNLTASLRICSEMIQGILDRQEAPHRLEVARIWPTISQLLATVCIYDGDHDILRTGIWIAFRAAKILVTVFGNSRSSTPVCFFYSPEEEDFASMLPFPIAAAMPLPGQVAALLANIEHVQRLLARA